MEPSVSKILKSLFSDRPKFEDGRIDYHGSDSAPVLICFVRYLDRILLLRRSDKVGTYKGLWNTVAGFIDEDKPLHDKVKEELKEEIGLDFRRVKGIRYAQPYTFFDSSIERTWIIFPVLVDLKSKPKIHLDWEHTDYTWIFVDDLLDYETIPSFGTSLRKVIA